MNIHAPIQPAALDDTISRQPKAFSLAQALYNSDDAYQRDLERLIFRYWMLAGHAGSAPKPGDWFRVDIAGESVIIVRGDDNQLRAFANVCRHRGSHVCTAAEGHSSVLVCPYHAWTYNLDGTLRGARHMGRGFDKKSYGLKPIAIEVVAGLVFISFADKPLSMETAGKAIEAAYGAYGWDSAKVAHRQTYRVEANWKLAVENYLECYHCAPSHPEYSRLHALEKPIDKIADLDAAMRARSAALGVDVPEIDHRVGSASGEQSVFIFRYPLYDGVETGSDGGKAVAPPMGAFTASDGGVTSAHFAPCNFFIAYADHGVIYRFMPVDAHTTDMELIWLVKGGAQEGVDYDLEKLTWLWQVTTLADKRITEDNQKGVNSRYYEPGPYAPVEQNAIAWIDWYLHEIA